MSEGDEVLVKYGKEDYHRAKLVRWVGDDQVECEWLEGVYKGSSTTVSIGSVHMSFDKRVKLGKRKASNESGGSFKRSKNEIYAFIQSLSDELGAVRKENAELRTMLEDQAKDHAIKMRESQQEIDASFQRFIERMEGMAEEAKNTDKLHLQLLKQQMGENVARLESKIDGVITFAGKAAKYNLQNFKKIHEVLKK